MSLCRALLVLVLMPGTMLSQTAPASQPAAAAGTIPAGAPLALTTDQPYPMRAGAEIHARLLYPIYADNQLVLPANTVVAGDVVALHPDHGRRVNAMLGGDFTPFHIPEVRFTHIVLANGTSIPFASNPAANGTQIYRAVAPPPAKGGVIHREFDSALNAARGDLAFFVAPGKGDRLLQWVYGRLPYHPQRIAKGTSWTVETAAPIDVPAEPEAPAAAAAAPPRKPRFWEVQTAAAPPENSEAWIVQANLADSLSSETSAAGQAIKAVVAEPIYNRDRTVAVPQGATLLGTVTRAKPARRFGRTGVLSFSFSQLVLPDKPVQTVETRLTGADSAANIALNSEGQAKSKPQDKIAIPLILALMAARPLDQDAGHRGGPRDTAGKDAEGGAAGLALVGTIVGIAGGSPYAAAGIGYWGAGRAVYSRWIARGQKITFPRDTRIVVETTPRKSAPMKPDSH